MNQTVPQNNRFASPPPQRRVSTVLVVALAIVAVAIGVGCTGAKESMMETDREDVIAVTIPDGRGASSLAVTQVSNEEPVDEPVAQSSLDELDFPSIPDHVNFFLPPKTTTVKVEVAKPEEESEQATIRLIGFVSSNEDDERSTLALLRIGEKLVPIHAGEEFESILLLSTNMQNRSVEIQHLDERMTLMMMDQPIENPAVPGLSPQPVRRHVPALSRNARQLTDSVDFNLPDPGFAAPPDLDLGRDFIPEGMDLELPEDLPLPEMPELPGLEGLPALP